MSQIDLEKCREFLDHAKGYFMPEVEQTFFDVGLRGHYENPTTELLAFFLDPNNAHGLGDYFLCGLFDALELDYKESGSFILVSREVQTEVGRIDLLIEMENTVIIIECKINHHVNNPLACYESYAGTTFKNKPNKVFVLLSITGEGLSKSGDNSYFWEGVSYENLALNIKKYMPDNVDCNKWQILARELLLQFKNYGVIKMDKEKFEFALTNLESINQLKMLEDALYTEVVKRVEHRLAEIKPRNIRVRHQVWDKTSKVIRFSLDDWQGEHDCALCFNKDVNKPFMIRTWVVESNEKIFSENLSGIPSKLYFDVKSGESETYKGNRWPRWDWWSKEIESAIELISQLILALDKIEKLADNKIG